MKNVCVEKRRLFSMIFKWNVLSQYSLYTRSMPKYELPLWKSIRILLMMSDATIESKTHEKYGFFCAHEIKLSERTHTSSQHFIKFSSIRIQEKNQLNLKALPRKMNTSEKKNSVHLNDFF